MNFKVCQFTASSLEWLLVWALQVRFEFFSMYSNVHFRIKEQSKQNSPIWSPNLIFFNSQWELFNGCGAREDALSNNPTSSDMP